MSALKPDTDDLHTLGTSDKKWKELHVHDIELKSSLKLEGSSSGVSTLATLAAAADTTINLPAMATGTYHLPVLASATTTAIAATPEELNLLDAGTARTAFAGGDGLQLADELIIDDNSASASKKIQVQDLVDFLETTNGVSGFASAVSITDSTASSSVGTGALKVDGGVGIDKELFVGLTANIAGIATFQDSLAIQSQPANALGIRFNSDRGENDINSTDYDVKVIDVFAGTGDATQGTILWDDDQSSFSVTSGKLHSETQFTVGPIATPNFTVAPTTGVIDVEGSAPVLTIKNTASDAVGGVLKLVNDKGAAGADNDVAGAIEFHADDDAQDQVKFAEIKAQVADASQSYEGGKLTLSVASHDGGLASGIVINGGTQITDATCDTTENSTTVTMDSTANLHVGMGVIGTGIPALATVASIHANGTEFTLSAQATASNNDETLTFINADDEVDVTIGNGSNSTVTIPGNLTVQGTTVTVDTTNLSVSDQNILINDGGSLANSAGAGLDIEAAGSVAGFMRVASSHANLEFKAPSGSTLTLDVDANKTLTVNGDLNISGDSVINQDLSSNSTNAELGRLTLSNASGLLPKTTAGGGFIDIGSATAEFGDIFVGDGKGLKLGADQDVTILHDSAVGLAIESTGDIGISSNAGSINIGADLADDQTLKLGKASTVQTIIAPSNTAGSELYSVINTAGDTTGADGAGAILLSSVAGGMGLAWNAAKALHAQGGTAVIAAEENIANAIKLHATAGSSQSIRLENTAGSADASTITDATCDTTENSTTVTMDDTSAIAANMSVSGTGIPAGAFVVSVTNGTSFVLSAQATVSNTNETLTFTKSAAIDLTASAGGVNIDAAAAKDVKISGGQLALTSKDDAASAISLTANVGTSETIVVTNTQGTADGTNSNAAAVQLTSTAGGMGLAWNDAMDLWAEGGRAIITANENPGSAGPVIKLHADAGANQTIQLLNDAGTDEAAIDLTASAGGVNIDAAAAKDVNIGGGQVALTSKDDAASAISLTANVGTSETIVITNTKGITDGSDDAGAIELSAAAGGIGLAWADNKDLWAEGGRAVITANENAIEAIKLDASSGANQTIKLLNTSSTKAYSLVTDTSCDLNETTTVSMDDTSAIAANMSVSGEGIPAGAFVVSVTNSTSFVLSAAATATSTDETLTFTTPAAIDLHAASGGFSIDGVQPSNITVDSAGNADDLTISVTGATDSSLFLTSAGTGVDAIDIDASAGSMLIGKSLADGKTLKIGKNAAVEMTFTPHGTPASEKWSLVNTAGTATDAISLQSVAGGITAKVADGSELILGNSNSDTFVKVLPHGTPASEKISITNASGTAADAIGLTTTAGGISLTSASTVTVDSDAFDITSDQANDPLVRIINTVNDADGARLRFVKARNSAAGEDNDVAGLIEFYAGDDNQDQVKFGEIKSQVADASNGAEGGKLTLSIASHDGGLAPGLILADGSADDEVDVTIGNGAASVTTVAGELAVTGALAVTGNLTVNGTTTTVNSTTLTVDDKNIELGVSGDDITGQTATLDNTVATVTVASTAGYRVGATLTKTDGGGAFKAGGVRIKSVDSSTQITVENDVGDAVHATTGAITFTVDNSDATDFTADGGGITLKATQDKTFNYVKSTESWTSSENLNLANGKEIKHNGTSLLSSSTLANSITSLAGITVAQSGGIATLGSGGAIGADFGAIDNGISNITTGGILKIDVDGTAINAAGSLTLGEGNDAGLYFKNSGNELFIENTVATGEIRLKIGSEELLRIDGVNDRVILPQGKLHIAKDNSNNLLEVDPSDDLAIQFKGPTRFESAVVLNSVTKTISSDSIEVTSGYHKLECPGSDTTDDLTSLTSGTGIDFQAGQILVLQIASAGDTITVKDNTDSGNIRLSTATFAMNSVNDTLTLIYNGTNWCETSKSDAAT